jgi:8-oxo-dGTP diphosphatase
MYQSPVLVSAAIIQNKDEVLIAQRLDSSTIESMKWEFPGGKVRYLEDPRSCLVREIKEEMNITIEVSELYDIASHVYTLPSGDNMHVIILFFLAKYLSGDLILHECNDAVWVSRDKLGEYDFVQADIPIRERLMDHSNP